MHSRLNCLPTPEPSYASTGASCAIDVSPPGVPKVREGGLPSGVAPVHVPLLFKDDVMLSPPGCRKPWP
eukprot:scaffold68468_cov36-Phaeocystis_antarctica.AAC.1